MSNSERRGIAAAGNWIVDNVKIIDTWPEQEALANILDERKGTGGAPYNVLMDLAALQAPFPLTGIGVLGCDEDGDAIERDMRERGVRCFLRRSETGRTSYTCVMTVRGTGRRTFFHNRGPNAEFAPRDVPLDMLDCRILHLGYLLLLESMDAEDEEYGTAAARLLADARRRGIHTSVDVVSESSDRFQRIARPALPHIDTLICNEIEGGRIAGIDIRVGDALDRDAMSRAAATLLELGVNETVVLHAPEGGYARDKAGREWFRSSLRLPPGYIQGSAGAGDAFCAGYLYGAHEGWGMEDRLTLAVCAAAASLSDPTCSAGMRPLNEVLALAGQYG
ncbi:MAG TPA: carbohydrate kinase family protein [Armatimonadota bacterium]|jgi:sugar/nucleoside kinase (ribokinase family)